MYKEKRKIDFDSKVMNDLKVLSQYFLMKNMELNLVGGCVRDILLGKEPKDYDLCTNATPEEMKTILSEPRYNIIETGIKHGTITVHDLFSDSFYEITTYRVDGKYSDNRHPDKVVFTPSLEEDLKRRDLTINSFAYNLLTEELIMLDKYFLDDLDLGVIRTVGDPAERYEEDALRMLRTIRFAAQLGFTIETYTYRALSMCAPLLQHVSHERIRDELTKILLSDNPQMLEFVAVSRLEDYIGDLSHPYLFSMLVCDHQNPWHYTDVFHHTMDVVKRTPKTFELRWAALLHDVGKPYVKALKPGTVDHYRYIGHPEKSAEIADEIMEVLKFSNSQKEIIHKYVLYHDYPFGSCSYKKFKEKVVEIGEENFGQFIKLIEADALSHRLAMSTNFAIEGIWNIKSRYAKLLSEKPPLRIKDLAVNGNDLINKGLSGKDIGETLNKLLQIVLENPDLNTKEKLLGFIK